MSKQANATVIGGFVLGAIGLVIIAVLALSSGLLRERVKMQTHFPGSVQGLNIGAQVQFQGVPIGKVTGIGLDFLPDNQRFRITVDYEIWPQNVQILGAQRYDDAEAVLRHLVQTKGLRAQLIPISFVTGQYLVALSLNPDLSPPDTALSEQGPVLVPAIAATRDRLDEVLSNLHLSDLGQDVSEILAKVRKILESGKISKTLDTLSATLVQSKQTLIEVETQLGPLVDSLSNTSTSIGQLSDRVNAEIQPLVDAANSALGDTSAAMRALDSLAGEGSPTRYQLDTLLEEATRTARSLRDLTDYLERHPEALLQGKR